MSSGGPAVFDKTLQETNTWLKALMSRIGSDDRQLAYSILRATLHAVRDRIGPESATHLGAQLPLLVRGIYYDGWRISKTPTSERHVTEFVSHVSRELQPGRIEDVEGAVSAALAVIRSMIDPGEALKIIQLFPAELRAFWVSCR
jgi:uncharacterized protein (DUF2267 family)